MSCTFIDHIDEVERAATRGPWMWDEHRVPTLSGRAGDPAYYEYDTEAIEAGHNGECGCRSACELELTISATDHEFMSLSRTAMPRLITFARQIQSIRDGLKTAPAGDQVVLKAIAG